MRNRTPLYAITGLLIGIVLVCASTNLAAGNRHTARAWMLAQQKNSLLLMIDGCAVIIFLGSSLVGAAIQGLQSATASQSDESTRHIAVLTETVQDLFQLNNGYLSRLEALEQAGDAWHDGFEDEARRLTEQAFLALSDNIETNALQLEAVNLALRYQRAEMQAVRAAFKTGEIAPETSPPPQLDAVDRPIKPILTEWRTAQKEIEATVDVAPERHIESVFYPASETIPVPEVDIVTWSDIVTEIDTDRESVRIGMGEEDDEDAAAADGANQPSMVLSEAEPEPYEELYAESIDHNGDEHLEPSLGSDQTVNAGISVVETLDFDASTASDLVGDGRDASSRRTALAAEEFRRSKQDPKSIFRQKRR
jgi:hypothetical protein